MNILWKGIKSHIKSYKLIWVKLKTNDLIDINPAKSLHRKHHLQSLRVHLRRLKEKYSKKIPKQNAKQGENLHYGRQKHRIQPLPSHTTHEIAFFLCLQRVSWSLYSIGRQPEKRRTNRQRFCVHAFRYRKIN